MCFAFGDHYQGGSFCVLPGSLQNFGYATGVCHRGGRAPAKRPKADAGDDLAKFADESNVTARFGAFTVYK